MRMKAVERERKYSYSSITACNNFCNAPFRERLCNGKQLNDANATFWKAIFKNVKHFTNVRNFCTSVIHPIE